MAAVHSTNLIKKLKGRVRIKLRRIGDLQTNALPQPSLQATVQRHSGAASEAAERVSAGAETRSCSPANAALPAPHRCLWETMRCVTPAPQNPYGSTSRTGDGRGRGTAGCAAVTAQQGGSARHPGAPFRSPERRPPSPPDPARGAGPRRPEGASEGAREGAPVAGRLRAPDPPPDPPRPRGRGRGEGPAALRHPRRHHVRVNRHRPLGRTRGGTGRGAGRSSPRMGPRCPGAASPRVTRARNLPCHHRDTAPPMSGARAIATATRRPIRARPPPPLPHQAAPLHSGLVKAEGGDGDGARPMAARLLLSCPMGERRLCGL